MSTPIEMVSDTSVALSSETWSRYQVRFPHVFKIAANFLVLKATSAELKCTFSIADQVATGLNLKVFICIMKLLLSFSFFWSWRSDATRSFSQLDVYEINDPFVKVARHF
jgi:hypothetical protein